MEGVRAGRWVGGGGHIADLLTLQENHCGSPGDNINFDLLCVFSYLPAKGDDVFHGWQGDVFRGAQFYEIAQFYASGFFPLKFMKLD